MAWRHNRTARARLPCPIKAPGFLSNMNLLPVVDEKRCRINRYLCTICTIRRQMGPLLLDDLFARIWCTIRDSLFKRDGL